MAKLANASKADLVICDFVAPFEAMRDTFAADCTIWLDTIAVSRYDDTNALFWPPKSYVFRVTEQNAEAWVEPIGKYLTNAI